MTLERGPSTTSAIDVLDHILDKGVVLDAWLDVSVAGIDLVTIEARVVVASIETYLTRAAAIAECVRMPPRLSPPAQPRPVDVQLRHIAEQMTRGLFEPQMHQRRADDRVRDERHDLYAATISSRTRRSRRPEQGINRKPMA
jgi:gas vesicle protein GvpA/GvpJ/GvpM family